MTGPLLLGVDGGGTRTEAWLADDERNVLGRGRAGPSNGKVVGLDAALGALDQAIERAFANAGLGRAPVAVACFGVAGFGRPDDQQTLRDWAARVGLGARVLTVTDADLVLAAGTPDCVGIGVISGTGSIAVGRNTHGRSARAGGWGPLLGDEGSAYAVALAALRRVARRADGREASPSGDVLTDRLCAALGVPGPSGLVSAIYVPGVDRTRIAALAPVVVEAARADPELVAALLEPAGRELGQAVVAVARALEWSEPTLPLALAGGFLLAAPDVANSLRDHVERNGYRPITTPVPEPVSGALVLACRQLTSPH
jgi:N-acetylglucosamine kinase-like BadF-type ATPase